MSEHQTEAEKAIFNVRPLVTNVTKGGEVTFRRSDGSEGTTKIRAMATNPKIFRNKE